VPNEFFLSSGLGKQTMADSRFAASSEEEIQAILEIETVKTLKTP
jgi:hypothetical protein